MLTDEPQQAHLALVPVLDTSRPNFRAVGWRVVTAAERLQELQRRIPDLADEWTGHPVVRARKETPDQFELSLEDWSRSQSASARTLTYLASEVLHHARTALDYCAYHLVWLDSGAARSGTKFPLVNEASKWGKEKRRSIPGVTAEHAEWIGEIQPFTGTDWSGWLLELSNRDKHHTAAEVVPTYRCRVNPAERFADPLGDAAYFGFQVEDSRLELNIAPAMTDPARGAGLPLEATLAGILHGVVDLSNRFLTEIGYTPIEFSTPGHQSS
ncbi:hypothetical protein [Nocardioides alpinus]|uniref:hypothetical protein n=1 Tax=Nocardioides alpinus TaxID=748909 RepID=UPI00111416D3|nr:hypothetical protein [Nocardioides alpinus]